QNFVNGVFTRRQGVSLEETHPFSSQLVNSVRLGYSRVRGIVNNPAGVLNQAATDMSLAAAPGRFAPLISVPGLTPNPGGGGLGSLSSFFHTWNSYQVYDDAFLTRGTHALKFGFAFEASQYNLLGTFRQNGQFNFGTLASFLTNRPTSLSVADPRFSGETGS